MGALLDMALLAGAEEFEAEIRGLVALIYADDTKADQADALAHALSDPAEALICYRYIMNRKVRQ